MPQGLQTHGNTAEPRKSQLGAKMWAVPVQDTMPKGGSDSAGGDRPLGEIVRHSFTTMLALAAEKICSRRD